MHLKPINYLPKVTAEMLQRYMKNAKILSMCNFTWHVIISYLTLSTLGDVLYSEGTIYLLPSELYCLVMC